MMIDIGGTPANILKSNKVMTAIVNGINPEQLVAIVDSFDLSRAERKLELGNYKLRAMKFQIEVPNTDLNSEMVNPPTSDGCEKLFESAENSIIGKIQSIYGKKIDIQEVKRKYSSLKQGVEELSKNSNNLREFMNGLIRLISPELRIIKLEEILINNKEIIYDILKKVDIPARAICPGCNCFIDVYLREISSNCFKCNQYISIEEIINSGKYIPQDGFLPVITYFCGYLTYSNDKEKMEQTMDIMRKIGKEGNLIKTYKKLEEEKTMFESFLLGD